MAEPTSDNAYLTPQHAVLAVLRMRGARDPEGGAALILTALESRIRAMPPGYRPQDVADEIRWAAEPTKHVVIVRRQWGTFAVICGTCDLYERHEDETTAYREAQRHEVTSPSGSEGTS